MKRTFLILLCVILAFSFPFFNTLGSSANKTETVISVDDISGNPGDTVFVPVKISENNGFSSIAFRLSFDKKMLEYKNIIGGFVTDYSIFNHSDAGKIVVAYTGDVDISDNGILITFEFAVKKKAKEGKYPVTLDNIYLKNLAGNKLKYTVNNNCITVSNACKGEHKYLDWKPVVQPNCTRSGINARVCEHCGHLQKGVIEAKGHSLERRFTTDVIAKNGNPGMLSRHCKNCNARVNIVIYTEENATPLLINNTLDKFSDDSLINLVYFLNGGQTYPEVSYEVTDVKKFIRKYSSVGEDNRQQIINNDKTINIDILSDSALRWFYGDKNQIGVFEPIKRAAISNEIPSRLICKLICLILI